MIADTSTQGTPEWFMQRGGRPSASNFNKIITTKGNPTKGETRKKYLYQLAGERLLGDWSETYQSDWMLRGIELEPTAREAYEFITGNTVDQVSSCYRNDERLYGCSPDGLIGDDGGLEIKCPSLPVHVEYLYKEKLPTAYFQQVQGSLFITERKWWDFMSFFPGVRAFIIRVEPDREFHGKLLNALLAFCTELDEITEQLNGQLHQK